MFDEQEYLNLAKKEGWEIERKEGIEGKKNKWIIIAEGQRFPLIHPYAVHLTLYRRATGAEEKFQHMKAAHDYLWPAFAYSWNHWDERRFRAHCEGYSHIILAGGASSAKSHCAARIACLFWLSNPTRHTCIVASTTLESLESRIWGYVARFISEAALEIPANILRSKPPKIMYPGSVDKIHGMFAVAIRQGEDETVLSTLIGRHPDKGLMVLLDEATDMNPAIAKALPNLEKGVEFFQLWAIGNSNSKNDLHGSLATPLAGWDSVEPLRDMAWATSHKNGICLYFNPYDSPAIVHEDPVKRALLGKFLATAAGIEEDKRRYGEDSDSFYRFVLGFWKAQSLDSTLVSEQFLTEKEINGVAEWSGFYPLQVVAGLDPAFAVGGSGCKLRLAVLGQTAHGLIALDYRGEELLFSVDIRISEEVSGEVQLATQVVETLRKYSCPVRNMAIDATGAGRALGELIRIISGEGEGPFKIVCSGGFPGAARLRKSLDPNFISTSPSELWTKFRDFVQHGQIKGLDQKATHQITNRLLTVKRGKVCLEGKVEYKTRMSIIDPKTSRSPDEADAAILALHAAVLRFGFIPGQKRDIPTDRSNQFWYQKYHAFYESARQKVPQGARVASGRVPLVPNFEHSLEESVGQKSRY